MFFRRFSSLPPVAVAPTLWDNDHGQHAQLSVGPAITIE
jgi:hypothetical protein